VVDQRPSGQTQVGQGTSVNLSIGRGITQVRVPDLVGGSADSAKNAVADSQLVYAEQQQPSSDADRGRVLAQVPDAQTAVPPGSTITVTVGTGQPLVTVPENLVGKSADEASQLLQAAGLSAVTQDGDGTEPVGQVIATDQPGNRPLPQGTPVTLTVSNNTLMVMPALQSQAPNRAVATLQNLGWAGDLGTLSMAGQATPSQALIGAVISQTPAAGSVVPKIGTPVHVGVGVRQITVPNLVGKTQAQAAALLGQAGATNVTFVDVGTAPRGQAGKVKSQSVPVNSPVAADTPIAISVYRN
ncbi:MAG TPA: PASTA domain-containing protein, partial [Nakamurella sp.]